MTRSSAAVCTTGSTTPAPSARSRSYAGACREPRRASRSTWRARCSACARATCRSRRGSPRRSTGSRRSSCSGSSASTPRRPTARSARCSSTATTRSSYGRRGWRRWSMADVDGPALAAAFGRRLHAAGLPVTPDRSARFARALALAPPHTRARLYWTARAVFVSTREEADTFDRVFGAVFDGRVDPADSRGDPNAPAPAGTEAGERRAPVPSARTSVAPMAVPGWMSAGAQPRSDGADEEREAPVALASDRERLAERSFATLDPWELAQLRRLMAQLELATPQRRSRRARRGRRGEHIDLRRTIRTSLRTGGDPVRHARRRRRTRPRRLVLLCDISGSMEPYARAYLQFLQSAAGGGAHAEAFVFATRLTRL